MSRKFATEFNKHFDACQSEFEEIVLTSGALLGMLGRINGDPFDPKAASPNTWPAILADAIERISKMTNRSDVLTAWLEGASKVLVAMHQAKIHSPN